MHSSTPKNTPLFEQGDCIHNLTNNGKHLLIQNFVGPNATTTTKMVLTQQITLYCNIHNGIFFISGIFSTIF